MLVLSRKIGERIVVPHCELAVTVIAIEGKAVRLGISAPDDIAVYREEVWQQQAGTRGQRLTRQDRSSARALALVRTVPSAARAIPAKSPE